MLKFARRLDTFQKGIGGGDIEGIAVADRLYIYWRRPMQVWWRSRLMLGRRWWR